MKIYVVTSKSTDKTTDNKINFVRTRCHGAMSDETRAASVAARYGGTYVELDLDMVEDNVILQYWENPGFVTQ